MNTIGQRGKVLLYGALLGAAVCCAPVSAATHNPPPPMHQSHAWHHGNGPGGWHGYHHGYGFYGYWPWYFPWAYGYGLPYYGVSFYDAPVTYVQMAPADAVQPANVWYYCRNPEGYFPYVKTCPSGWQTVPIQPVPAQPAAPASPATPAAPAAPAVPPPPPPA